MRSLYPDAPSLRHLQEWMAARILGPAGADRCDRGAPLDEWLHVPTPARAADRLGVYIGGYPFRIQESLAEVYPAVAHMLGAQDFDALADRYAARVPLTSYNLNDAGAQMPAFLRGDRLSAGLPFLPDLAELEWRVAQAFHAEQCTPLDPRTLGWSVDDWTSAVLHFQPAVAVVSSAWPLLELWAGRDTPRDQIDIELCDRPDHVVVRRAGLTVRCESVSAAEARALSLLLADGRLFEAAARLEAEGLDAGAVLEWFSRWTSAGMIASATRDCG